MSRRRRFTGAAAALLGAVVAALVAQGAGEDAAVAQRDAPKRPDIVLLMTDDQTVENLRVMQRTRALLADRGTTFANSFSSYPLCCPSRATMLTGQYAHNHKVLGNRPPTGGYEALTNRANTLPGWLQRAGYDTIHIGKYLNGYGVRTPAEVPPGWSDWHGSIDPSTYVMWGYRLNENGQIRQYGRPRVERPALYQTDVYRDKAVQAIRSRANSRRPFYLSVAFLAPHAEGRRSPGPTVRSAPRHRGTFAAEPLPRGASFNEADVSDKPAILGQRFAPLRPGQVAAVEAAYRGRLESLLAVDEAVAAIVGALRQTGRLERTLIIFTSDNGFFHGEHRVPNGKYLVYEPSVRVPLIVRGPGIPRGGTSRELVSNVDLAATIAQAARARPRRVLDGRSLLPFARRPGRHTDRALVLETGQTVDSGDLDQDGGPGGGLGGGRVPTYRAVRTDRYKYVEHSTGDRELYDLALDRDELGSVHADARYSRTLAALQRELRRLRRCRGAACRRETRPIPGPSGGDDRSR
jgi:arylsulfatase A-like enzyme